MSSAQTADRTEVLLQGARAPEARKAGERITKERRILVDLSLCDSDLQAAHDDNQQDESGEAHAFAVQTSEPFPFPATGCPATAGARLTPSPSRLRLASDKNEDGHRDPELGQQHRPQVRQHMLAQQPPARHPVARASRMNCSSHSRPARACRILRGRGPAQQAQHQKRDRRRCRRARYSRAAGREPSAAGTATGPTGTGR